LLQAAGNRFNYLQQLLTADALAVRFEALAAPHCSQPNAAQQLQSQPLSQQPGSQSHARQSQLAPQQQATAACAELAGAKNPPAKVTAAKQSITVNEDRKSSRKRIIVLQKRSDLC
jgi:hypothetical protein